MSYKTTCAVYLIAICLVIGTAAFGWDVLLIVASFVATMIGLALLAHFVKQQEFYTAIFFSAHLAMYGFTLYVYLNADRVLPIPEFNFSVLTAENLRSAIIALALTSGAIAMACLLSGSQPSYRQRLEVRDMLYRLAGKLAFLQDAQILGLVAISFLTALLLYVYATSVLQVPYPLNLEEIPYPADLLKIPLIFAILAFVAVHARMLLPRSHDRQPFSLLLTRTNLIVSGALSLLIMGARGYATFIWAVAALIEFYSTRKRQTIPVWGLIFVFSTYFLFAAWPLLRVELSSIDAGEALRASVEAALRIGETVRGPNPNLIDLDSYPMVGQSLFHLLYVIQLEHQGTSLAGSTFLNLIPQALPSFLDGIFWNRPLNDNWKLAEYYVQGGGFLAIANAYWNGGMAVMAAFVACVCSIFLYIDHHLTKPDTTTIYKVLYVALSPIVIVQLFYGIQGLAKPIEVLALVAIVEKLRGAKRVRLIDRGRSAIPHRY